MVTDARTAIVSKTDILVIFVCSTLIMMVFGKTRLGHEPTTYRVRGGHAYPTTHSPYDLKLWLT